MMDLAEYFEGKSVYPAVSLPPRSGVDVENFWME